MFFVRCNVLKVPENLTQSQRIACKRELRREEFREQAGDTFGRISRQSNRKAGVEHAPRGRLVIYSMTSRFGGWASG